MGDEEVAKRAEQEQLEKARLEKERQEKLEQERVQEQNRLEKEQREAQQHVATFLKDNGFKGVNDKRKKMLFSCYPLHVAVEKNNADIVKSLLRCGADPKQKNSSGQTPQDLAHKCNKKGSHTLVLQAIQHS